MILTAKLALGISLLSIPQTLISLSFVFGLLLIIVLGIYNWFTFNMLAFVCNKHKVYDYSLLMRNALGKKADYIYNSALIFSSIVTIIAYNNVGK